MRFLYNVADREREKGEEEEETEKPLVNLSTINEHLF